MDANMEFEVPERAIFRCTSNGYFCYWLIKCDKYEILRNIRVQESGCQKFVILSGFLASYCSFTKRMPNRNSH